MQTLFLLKYKLYCSWNIWIKNFSGIVKVSKQIQRYYLSYDLEVFILTIWCDAESRKFLCIVVQNYFASDNMHQSSDQLSCISCRLKILGSKQSSLSYPIVTLKTYSSLVELMTFRLCLMTAWWVYILFLVNRTTVEGNEEFCFETCFFNL